MAPMEAAMDLAGAAGDLVTWAEEEAGAREAELEELLEISLGDMASSGEAAMVSRTRATVAAMASRDTEDLAEAVVVEAHSVVAAVLEAEVR